jgi:PDZ domain-containing protein
VHRRWAVPLAVLAGLVPVAVAVAAFLPAQIVATTDTATGGQAPAPFAVVPASAQPVGDRISFGELEGVAQVDQDSAGDFFFVTVSEPAQSLLSHWVGKTEPAIRPLTYEQKYGTATPAQQRSVSLQMMRTSEQVAQYVALQAVGIDDAELVPGEVIVEQVLCLAAADDGSCAEWAPADDVLDPGDKLLEAEGQPLSTVDDLIETLGDNSPGDRIELLIERPGEDGPRTVQVELIDAPGEPGRTIVGFVPFDTTSVRLPFEMDIDTGRIGGPSAGLAFTLTLIDQLSAGDLAGGQNIAVTGTIGLEGEVGAIGGLPQKVEAVRQVGVEHFLVPATQNEETMRLAEEIAGDEVELIPVANVDEALAALEALGGDPVTPYVANAD